LKVEENHTRMREMQGYLDITEGVFSKTTWERPGKVNFRPYYKRCKVLQWHYTPESPNSEKSEIM